MLSSNRPRGLLARSYDFLRQNKLWWILPIVLVALALLGVALAGSFGGYLPPMYR